MMPDTGYKTKQDGTKQNETKGKGLKMLTPKPMLQIPIPLQKTRKIQSKRTCTNKSKSCGKHYKCYYSRTLIS